MLGKNMGPVETEKIYISDLHYVYKVLGSSVLYV